ncbi:MAG: AAA family ATPase [Minicystis sp.]
MLPARAPLPLSCRLPNPPALFVGRKAEMDALDAAVARGPVVVVAGEGGIGKSALVLQFLQQRRAAEVDGAVFASLRGADPREHVALGIARALVQAAGLRSVAWSELLGAPDALGALALDLAEARGAWVVLDDLHHGDAAEVLALLRQIARYARRSRWLATTRALPAADELAGQILTLDPMKPAEMLKLARALDPSASPAAQRRAVAAAAGSPWRLRRMRGTPSGRPPAPPSALSDLAEDTLLFLQALLLVSIPLPRALVDRIAPGPVPDLEALAQRGLIEGAGAGVRLHELTRDVLPRPADTPSWRAWRARAGSALGAAREPEIRAQAASLLLDAGRPDDAAALLDEAGEALLAGGYATGLWRTLEAHRAAGAAVPRLDHWRLRSAVDVADAEVLENVAPPAGSSLSTRVLWARLLHAKGRMADAEALAAAAYEEARAAGDADLGFGAGMLWAQCIANGGNPRGACRLLEALDAPDAAASADRDALLAIAFAMIGAAEKALQRVLAVRRRLPELSPPLGDRAGRRVARALTFLGRLREAREVLDALVLDGAGASVRLDAGRELRYARATLAVDAGDLEGARHELDRLDPYIGRAALLRPYLINAWAHLAFAAGDLGDLDARLLDLAAERVPAQLREEVDALSLRLCVLRREPPADADAAPASTGSIYGTLYRIHRAEIDVRHGAITPAEAIARIGVPAEPLEIRAAAGVARATAELLAGAAEQALSTATAAVADAAESGYTVREAEARQLVCEIAIVLARRDPAARAAAELERLARALPSARFARAARLYQTLAADLPDVAVLEALAADASAAPDVAFHARALLGAEAPGDAVDRLVRAAILRAGWKPPTAITSPPRTSSWQPGWGLDEARRQVWLPDGRRVDLARHPVPWRLLTGLAAHGGHAGKEALVVAVWEERAYHPLRHDNRLQAAVRKLRVEIEADPSSPTRVLTTSDGYALGGVVRFLAG